MATPSPDDPRQAMLERTRSVLAITQPTKRLAAFRELLASATGLDDVDAILQTFQALFSNGQRFDAEWDAFWRGIASRDVQLAIRLIQKHGPDTSWNATALGKTLNEWGGKDPAAAVSWLAANQAATV